MKYVKFVFAFLLTAVVLLPGCKNKDVAVNNSTDYGKVIEVDYTTRNVLFEATLTPPETFYGITLHRSERINLYP